MITAQPFPGTDGDLTALAESINAMSSLRLPAAASNPAERYQAMQAVIRRGDPLFPKALIYHLKTYYGIIATLEI